MDSKLYRLDDLIRSKDKRSLIVDASAGLSLGTLPGLEDFERAVRPVLPLADGLVCSAGQLRRLSARTRHEAGLLVRMDWTNTLRDADFVLPPVEARRVAVLTPQAALDLGAVAMVSSFLLGYAEEIEAACLYDIAQWALEGKARGLPLVVEVRATGSRVAIPDKAIELGASYALEAGADVIAIPYSGIKSLKTIGEFVSVPLVLKPSTLESARDELAQALETGAAGLWLDHSVFAQPDPPQVVQRFAAQVHQSEATPCKVG